MNKKSVSIIGSIIGTAVGDSIGLPCEGLSPQRLRKIFPPPLDHKFFLGRGMVSDDTEHTLMVARSILQSGGDRANFLKSFARQLKLWFLGLPAGMGKATALSCIKLLLGFSGKGSGIFSAGNGPSMRSAIIGAVFGEDLQKMKEIVAASARVSHSDPKAEYGALAVALASGIASGGAEISPEGFLARLRDILPAGGEEFLSIMEKSAKSAGEEETLANFCEKMGFRRGISGYTYHTVPAVIQVWLRRQSDFRLAIEEIIYCGGDTDTTGAILGGIIGARVGKDGIPADWIKNIWEWPRTVEYMEKLGEDLADFCLSPQKIEPPPYYFLASYPRNVFFLAVVLSHGFARIFLP